MATIGSDNGLAPTRLQAIIWTNDGKITNAYITSLWLNDLNQHIVAYWHHMAW